MTTASDIERDEALSQLADLTDTFGYESVRNMLDTLERNDSTAQRSEQP